MDYKRSERVEELLRQVLAEAIIKDLKDPRFEKVTVTEVKMTPDLRHATIYISSLGSKRETHEAREGLEHAVGFLRRTIGQELRLKYLPELHFVIDDTIEKSMRIEKILKKIQKEHNESGD